jgi:hypothetical protein
MDAMPDFDQQVFEAPDAPPPVARSLQQGGGLHGGELAPGATEDVAKANATDLSAVAAKQQQQQERSLAEEEGGEIDDAELLQQADMEAE